MRRHLEVAVRHHPGAWNRVHTLGEVAAGVHRDHARTRAGVPDVDAAHARVRPRAAQHGGVEHPRELDVVRVRRGSGDESRILAALDGLAEWSRSHCGRGERCRSLDCARDDSAIYAGTLDVCSCMSFAFDGCWRMTVAATQMASTMF